MNEKEEKILDEKISKVINGGKVEFDFEKWKKNNPEAFEALNNPGKRKQRNSRRNLKIFVSNSLVKLAVAAVIIIAVVIGINHFIGPINIARVGWADVVEKFKSVKFFNATIYIKENASSEPKQIEIWRNSEQKTRIRTDSQVLFARAGQIIAGYNFEQKRKLSEDEYDYNGLIAAQKLSSLPEFSLDAVVKFLYEGRLEEITPKINPDAMISEDMLVFDVQSPSTPEWMRIWALRESKLPVMIRMWDPRYGRCFDVFMTYSQEQLPDFFEPSKFEKILLDSSNTTRGNRTNLAYALLQDSGGRDYVPKDLFVKSGYHIPVVEMSGITKYGAVWIVASKSKNQRPDGNVFFGFSKMTDDLGRKYEKISGIHRTAEDISIEVFVPDDYPFDERTPNVITLQCEVAILHPDEPEEIIGTIDINSLKPNGSWPKERLRDSEFDVMLKKARVFANQRKYDNASKIINFVEELNKDGQYAFQIDRLNLIVLVGRREFAQADLIAEKNWKQEMDSYIKAGPNASPERLVDYIIAIAANGRIDRAAQMVNEVKTTRPDYSKYSLLQQKQFLESLKKQLDALSGYQLVQRLFYEAGLNLESVNQIMGFNVLENDPTKWYVPEKYRMPQNK